MTVPADIVNRALDSIGRSDLVIGELGEGTEAAKPALRAYGPALRQLLRTAHWGFARKAAPLTLLGDATGQTAGVGTTVVAPWVYEYAFPIDGVKARFVPWNNIQQSPTSPPIMTGLATPSLNGARLIPAPFLVSLDWNYPVTSGVPPTWSEETPWWEVYGEGPAQRTVVLTNVQSASMIYTAFVPYPSQWDDLFTEALVQLLASRLAMPLARDRREARAIRDDAVAMGKQMITEARLVNANESGFPQTTDHTPDFIRARNAGSGWGAQGLGQGGLWNSFGGAGMWWGGYDAITFGDGSVY